MEMKQEILRGSIAIGIYDGYLYTPPQSVIPYAVNGIWSKCDDRIFSTEYHRSYDEIFPVILRLQQHLGITMTVSQYDTIENKAMCLFDIGKYSSSGTDPIMALFNLAVKIIDGEKLIGKPQK